MKTSDIEKIKYAVGDIIEKSGRNQGWGRLFIVLGGKNCLDILPPIQRRVIEYRFGLNDGIVKTLEETGKYFGTSRERIRQTCDKSFGIIKQQYNIK